uniref:UDP-glucuronosyltransferase n=1 Tax=Photinus pyralis TaxID=7054 RepID=A0A1Y1K0R3_PHOPY
MNVHLTTLLFLYVDFHIEAAQILGVFPFPAHSHFQLGDRIVKELVSRGHNVTVISPYKEKLPIQNFNQVIVDNVFEKAAEMKKGLLGHTGYNFLRRITFLDNLGLTYTELALNSTNVKNFLKERNHFDLVIIQHFKSDAYNGFCHRYKAPCIAVSPMPVPSWFSNKVGLSAPSSYVPQLTVSYGSKMDFVQRSFNSFVSLLEEISHRFYLYPAHNRLLQTYFPGAPHLDDLYQNTSLILYNGHVSVSEVCPNMPNTIDIAGYHVATPKGLPDDLKKCLDNATDGAIYFSMGSNLKSSNFPSDLRNTMLDAFAQLKQKVLWKFEDDLVDQPDNVLIRPWFPQQEILAHPNVILFITHGGLLSTIESVYFGKPILGLPVFSDQGLNSARAEDAGYGRFIPFGKVSGENFREILNEMIQNPRYMSNAKARSRIMHDQPLPPMERAIFWIEYVLRHRGAPHLKSPALSLNWFQYFLLDAILAFAVCCWLTVFALRRLLQHFNFTTKKLEES